MVGFEDEAEKLKGYLLEESEEVDVISIVGMPGLGKTTMAGKVFRDPQIQYEFPTRIWVHVSVEFSQKNIFLSILRELTRIAGDIYDPSDMQGMANLVAHYLGLAKFLLVIEDVRTHEDCDRLRIALPKNNNLGKVLITSCHLEVGRHANPCRNPLLLRFMTLEESLLLLQLEVFGKPEFPPDLEVEGRLIVEQCGGLPLAIVVIARKHSC